MKGWICSEYQIWVSFTTQMLDSVLWNSPRNFAASCTLWTQHREHCTLEKYRARRSVSSLLFNHVLEVTVTYRKFVRLLRIDDTSIHLYIYIYPLRGTLPSLNWNNLLIEITCWLYCCWLLRTSTVKKTFILCILCGISVTQRSRRCYSSVTFWLYKVSCVDWIRNFINFEPSKFGYW